MERLLAYQGPVVNADHSHRVAAPTAGCDEDLEAVQEALTKATKLKNIRTGKLNECMQRELDDEDEKRYLEGEVLRLERILRLEQDYARRLLAHARSLEAQLPPRQ